MTQNIVALVGVSGVGKTWALSSLARIHTFQHLRAGQLIGEARTAKALDKLRYENIGENQQLLIAGFWKVLDRSSPSVVLDGHTIIETSAGVEPIEARVFEELYISSMVFIADDPGAILERRKADTTRVRPIIEVEILRDRQEFALLTAFRICQQLKRPLTVVAAAELDSLAYALFNPSR